MNVHLYTEYETMPADVLRQFRAMRIRRYFTVPAFVKHWRNGRPGLVACVEAPPAPEAPGPYILAWCMILKTPTGRTGEARRLGNHWHLVSYVRQDHRRQGYGSQAVKMAIAAADKLWPDHGEFVVYPHDTASNAFLAKKKLNPDAGS